MRRTVSIAAMLACSAILAARCGSQTSPRPPLTPSQRAASDPRVYQAQQEVEKKNYAKAVELLTGFLKDYPKDATAHFQLGYVYGILKRSDDSLSEYRHAAELKPDFAEAQLNIGLILLEAKDFSGAAVALQRAAELTPTQAKPRYLAGLAMERSGDISGAIAQFRVYLEHKAGDAQARLKLATTFYTLGKSADALAELDRADAAASRIS